MFTCSFTDVVVSFVFKDIDSEKPMMQIGQYLFAGEYEGKHRAYKKNPMSFNLLMLLEEMSFFLYY